jgi:hypothetical protein
LASALWIRVDIAAGKVQLLESRVTGKVVAGARSGMDYAKSSRPSGEQFKILKKRFVPLKR